MSIIEMSSIEYSRKLEEAETLFQNFDYDLALDILEGINTDIEASKKYPEIVIKAYNLTGRIYKSQSEIFLAKDFFNAAHKIATKIDHESIKQQLSCIGWCNMLKYEFDEAQNIFLNQLDEHSVIAANGLSMIECLRGNHLKALVLAQQSLAGANEGDITIEDTVRYKIVAYINIARIQWILGDNHGAKFSLSSALQMIIKDKSSMHHFDVLALLAMMYIDSNGINNLTTVMSVLTSLASLVAGKPVRYEKIIIDYLYARQLQLNGKYAEAEEFYRGGLRKSVRYSLPSQQLHGLLLLANLAFDQYFHESRYHAINSILDAISELTLRYNMFPYTVECLILKGLMELSLPERNHKQIMAVRIFEEAMRLAKEHSLTLVDKKNFNLYINPDCALDLFKKRLNIALKTCFALR